MFIGTLLSLAPQIASAIVAVANGTQEAVKLGKIIMAASERGGELTEDELQEIKAMADAADARWIAELNRREELGS